jgi:NAD(P)H-dependent flavin oxidoreductase YrpB (nitropropane dioxygenase family)
MIVEAASEDAIKFDAWNDIIPPLRGGGYKTSLRAIRTPFIDHWQQHRDEAGQEADRLWGEILAAVRQGKQHELVPGAGQSAGLIGDILPAGEIMHQMVIEAARALEQSARVLG